MVAGVITVATVTHVHVTLLQGGNFNTNRLL